MYTINFIAGDTYTNIPDKTSLITLWSELLFDHVDMDYKITEGKRTIIDGKMCPEDIITLEKLPY